MTQRFRPGFNKLEIFSAAKTRVFHPPNVIVQTMNMDTKEEIPQHKSVVLRIHVLVLEILPS